MRRRVLATFGSGDCGRLGHSAVDHACEEVPRVVRALVGAPTLDAVTCGGAVRVSRASGGQRVIQQPAGRSLPSQPDASIMPTACCAALRPPANCRRRAHGGAGRQRERVELGT